MSFLDLVRTRRSVRHYRPDPVPRAAIERCLEAARLAPSACNSQPWSFIVVDDPDTRARLAAAAFGGVYSMCAFAESAPVLVVVITHPSRLAARLGGLWRRVAYNLIDIGIAGEHFALQAAEEGLGTCWLGWFHARGVRRVLGLPRSTRIDVLFSVGYPAEAAAPEAARARRPLDDVRTYR
jgi:nitroreductase